jgi:hypothetical protein
LTLQRARGDTDLMPFAVVNHVRVEDPGAAAISMQDVVIPRLRELPGFVQALLLADTDRVGGIGVMVFASKEQADDVATRLRSGQVPSPSGIVFERQLVFEVIAHG